jgi:hypothetical protein
VRHVGGEREGMGKSKCMSGLNQKNMSQFETLFGKGGGRTLPSSHTMQLDEAACD